MSSFPALPRIPSVPLKSVYDNLDIDAAAGWQNLGVPVEPLEKVTLELSGSIVWHYKEWTSAGACGAPQPHVEQNAAGPGEEHGWVRYGVAQGAGLPPPVQFDVKPEARNPQTVVIPEDLAGRSDLRLVGGLEDALAGGGGDNRGSYTLAAEIDWSARWMRWLDLARTAGDDLRSLITQASDDADEGRRREAWIGARVADLVRWFPSRVTLDAARQKVACGRLVELGQACLGGKAPCSAAAEYFGTWAVTPEHGGLESFGDGWALRGKAMAELGLLAAAQTMFAKSIQAGPSGRVLYDLGKLQEMAGRFSPKRGKEIVTLEKLKEVLQPAAQGQGGGELAGVSAVDLYRLALGEGVSRDVAGKQRQAGTAFDTLLAYDVHYALGRLGYLRHTTASLREAARHFREARRLSKYRLLTHRSLFGSYSLQAWFKDAIRIQPNPFHTEGRPGAPSQAVGVEGMRVHLKSTIQPQWQDKVAAAAPVQEDPLAGADLLRLDWVPIAGPGAGLLTEVMGETWIPADMVKGAVAKVRVKLEAYVAAGGALDPERIAGDLSGLTGRVRALVTGSPSVAAIASEDGEVGLLDWLQNPLYWVELLLREPGWDKVAKCSLDPLAVPWDAYRLVSVQPSDADESQLELEFRAPGGESARCFSKLNGERLQPISLELSASPQEERAERQGVTWRIDFGGDVHAQRGLWRSQGVSLKITRKPGATDAEELGRLDVNFEYDDVADAPEEPDGGRRLAKVVIMRWWDLDAVADRFSDVRVIATHQLLLGDPCSIVRGHGSLATAYVPFHRHSGALAFRSVTVEDASWAAAQPHLPSEVALDLIREMARRTALEADPSPSATAAGRSAEDFLFDVACGHFQATLKKADLAARALAAGALLAAGDRRGGGASAAYATEARLRLCSILDGLRPGTGEEDEASAQVARELAGTGVRLVPFDPPALVRAPGPERAAPEPLTRAVLDALARFRDRPQVALHLVRAVHAAGLRRTAMAWLMAAGAAAEGSAAEAMRWLAADSPPASPDEGDFGTVPRDGVDLVRTCGSAVRALQAVFREPLDPATAPAALAALFEDLGYSRSGASLGGEGARHEALLDVKQVMALVHREASCRGQQCSSALRLALAQLMAETAWCVYDSKLELSAADRSRGARALELAVESHRRMAGEAASDDAAAPLDEAAAKADWERTVASMRLEPAVQERYKESSFPTAPRSPWRMAPLKPSEVRAPLQVTGKEADPMAQALKATAGTWELLLHDEVCSDGCRALLALADRHLARRERAQAEAALQSALTTVLKLAADDSDEASPADRAQAAQLLAQVRLRLAWLDDGRDAYGRFVTQAPPRRLSSLVSSLRRSLGAHREVLEALKNDRRQAYQRLRDEAVLDVQRGDASSAVRQAELEVERSRRLLADAQEAVGRLESRRGEVEKEVSRGISQLEEGKRRADKAVDRLGQLALSAMNSFLPVAGPLAKLGLDGVDLSKVTQFAGDLASGKSPLQAAAGAFGQDLIGMTFSTFDAKQLFSGELEKVVGSALEGYRTNGSVALGSLAGSSLRRVGEDLFHGAVEQFAQGLDDLKRRIPDVAAEVSKVEDKVRDALQTPFPGASELRVFVNQVQIKADAQVRVLTQVLEKAKPDVLDDLRKAIPAVDLPLPAVIGHLVTLAGDAKAEVELRTHAEQAIKRLGKAVLSPKHFGLLCGGGVGAAAEALGRAGAILTHLAEEAQEQAAAATGPVLAQLRSALAASTDLLERSQRLARLPVEGIVARLRTTARGAFQEALVASVGEGAASLPLLAGIRELLPEHPKKSLVEQCQFLADAGRTLAQLLERAAREVEAAGQLEKPKLEQAMAEVKAWVEALPEEKGALGEGLLRRIAKDGELLTRALERVRGVVVAGAGLNSVVDAGAGLDEAFPALAGILEVSASELLLGKGALVRDTLVRLAKDGIGCEMSSNGLLEAALNAGLGPVVDAGTQKGQPKQTHLEKAGKLEVRLAKDDLINGDSYIRHAVAESILRTLPELQPQAPTQRDREEVLARPATPQGTVEAHEDTPEHPYVPAKDEITSVLSSPGAQVVMAGVAAAVPALGVAVQVISLINDWLCGNAERQFGAAKATDAANEARRLDSALGEARKRRALLELEGLAAQESGRAAQARVAGLARVAARDAEASDSDAFLRRESYRRLGTWIEVETYQTYLLQRAFEYEFDTPLPEIFERWGALERFRPVLELSPGLLEGDIDRTAVVEDLESELLELERIPEAVALVADLAVGTRYRDRIAVSLRADFPLAWRAFVERGTPILFDLGLGCFGADAPDGRPLRHSVKVRRVHVTPWIKGVAPGRDPAWGDLALRRGEGDTPPKPPPLTAPRGAALLRDTERRARAKEEKQLLGRYPERLKLRLYHAGVGDQVDEAGLRRRVEWGPQVADSNLDVESPGERYRAVEGLTPAALWIWDYDRSSPIQPEDFEDVVVSIEVTYGRVEQHVRSTFESLRSSLASVLPVAPAPRAAERVDAVALGAGGEPSTGALPRSLGRQQVRASRARGPVAKPDAASAAGGPAPE